MHYTLKSNILGFRGFDVLHADNPIVSVYYLHIHIFAGVNRNQLASRQRDLTGGGRKFTH